MNGRGEDMLPRPFLVIRAGKGWYNPGMRKFIFAVVLMLSILFIIGQFAELQALVETIQRGDLRYLALALVIETAWLMNLAASYLAIFSAIGIEEKVENVLFIATAANFVGIVAPSVGMSGVALFIAEARRRNYSPARAAIAGALYVLFDYVGIICALALGLIVLIRRGNLTTVEITASAILVSIALVLALLLYLGMKSAQALGKALSFLARLVNYLVHPFTHRQYLSETRAIEFAHDAAEGLHELRRAPRKMLAPIGLALINKTLQISILLYVFLAFHVPISAGTIVAGFSIGYLFLIVSPTPAGLGVVEGAMTIFLSSMYIPLEAAAVVTLVYRGITFWVPLLFGMIAFRLLSRTIAPATAGGTKES
jgi:uncharacterized protein (TIRG00374 family)